MFEYNDPIMYERILKAQYFDLQDYFCPIINSLKSTIGFIIEVKSLSCFGSFSYFVNDLTL